MSVNRIVRKAVATQGSPGVGSSILPRNSMTIRPSTSTIWCATSPWDSRWTVSAASLLGASARQKTFPVPGSNQYVT
jgi:hypothetical protein